MLQMHTGRTIFCIRQPAASSFSQDCESFYIFFSILRFMIASPSPISCFSSCRLMPGKALREKYRGIAVFSRAGTRFANIRLVEAESYGIQAYDTEIQFQKKRCESKSLNRRHNEEVSRRAHGFAFTFRFVASTRHFLLPLWLHPRTCYLDVALLNRAQRPCRRAYLISLIISII